MSTRKVSALTERERQVLRLLARGHDIKSAARDLSISTSAVSDRLRQARRKLGVSTSREAARVLTTHESADEFDVHRFWGIRQGYNSTQVSPPIRFARSRVAMTTLIAAVAAISMVAINLPSSHAGDPAAPSNANASKVQSISCGSHRSARGHNVYFGTNSTGSKRTIGARGAKKKAEFCATF